MIEVYEELEGRRIRTRSGVKMRRTAANFPGWQDLNFRDYLLEVPANVRGTITHVVQHGSAPYTRFCIELSDGSHMSDAIWGEDFDLLKQK